MQYPTIQHLGMRFIGFFDYDINEGNRADVESKFEYSSYYEKNIDYFDQKYYHNWLKTLYPRDGKLKEMGIPFLKGNHLALKNTDAITAQSILTKTKEYQFKVNGIDTYLFRENLGIFSIDIQPGIGQWSFEDISDFTNAARFTKDTAIVEIVNQNILKVFGSANDKWRTYNPHFKLFLNIDVKENFDSQQQLDHLLFELATVSPPGSSSSGELYAPSASYYSKIMDNNTIHVFNNWKTICITDSLVRISVNLKTLDVHQLWENDYYSIYIFTLFIRFYLYRTNRLLAETFNLKKSANTRNAYINFMNDFDLSQISYKFLPNEIYKKLLSCLDVTEELNKLDQKINRIDKSINEFQQKRIDIFIRYLVIVGLLPVSWEGSELLSLFFYPHEDSMRRPIAILLFLSLIVFGFFLYYIIGKKESIFLKKDNY